MSWLDSIHLIESMEITMYFHENIANKEGVDDMVNLNDTLLQIKMVMRI